MQRKKGLSNFIVTDGMLRYWKAEVAAAASVPFSVILKMIYNLGPLVKFNSTFLDRAYP